VREQGAMDFSAFSGEEFDAKVCRVCVQAGNVANVLLSSGWLEGGRDGLMKHTLWHALIHTRSFPSAHIRLCGKSDSRIRA
jgi:hypothetical protein